MEKFILGQHTLDEIVTSCLAALKKPGTVLLVPTETVYGLICRWDDKAGIDKIYELKGRERGKPLAMFADSVGMLHRSGIKLCSGAVKLTSTYCPGPITIVSPGPKDETVGFRIPDYPFILQLIRKAGFPFASTSANRSGEPNVLTVDEALAQLDGDPDIVIDGGAIPANSQASTVVYIASDNDMKILREGPISEEEILKTLA
jgi:L-threonylcarbamoyladenylate synthase